MNQIGKLEICKQDRKYAAISFNKVLRRLLQSNNSFSEVNLRDEWLKELRKNKDIFQDGWYIPPPHGITTLFASGNNPGRTNFDSLRAQKYWPNKEITFNSEDGIIVAYSSMVNRKTGIISDFGITLYFGKNKVIQNHFRNILNLEKEIFDQTKLGMTYADVYNYAEKIFKKYNLSNDWWVNITDPSGRNIGHTIPVTYEDWDTDEIKLIQNGDKDWEPVYEMIRRKRKFVSPTEQLKITPGMIFTIEPRLRGNKKQPIVWLHNLVVFKEDGNKEFVNNFDALFTLAGMDYMI